MGAFAWDFVLLEGVVAEVAVIDIARPGEAAATAAAQQSIVVSGGAVEVSDRQGENATFEAKLSMTRRLVVKVATVAELDFVAAGVGVAFVVYTELVALWQTLLEEL
ncbi:hypothetical protein NUU61_003439 [Penicillium alfredii]|uniref:Uncharacterized protein n=1 Tax=Penicillium alfredii TaxID=1506179 RepID=A0A9W9FTK9_9EURO|nr:uncharacterized protein NUU61_003439 [Penicillium alfredii]KAJ5106092.1 hypothetical protein NUU61_003439 [Penicillium alfredii]